MKIITKIVVLTLALTGMVACGGSSDGGGDTGNPNPPQATPPSAATLVFPENNTECNEGENLNEMQSRVTFRWEASANTDTYEVNLRNLTTDATSRVNATVNEASIVIDRGAPYEWFVVSRATGVSTTASSATERFYNQGPGIENYAPFPAEAINPARGANINSTGTIALEWSATDVDDDITGFTILFGTESTPTNSIGDTTATTLETSISGGQTYYWRVISTDSAGNTSQSEVFQFRTL
ncbi:hypothetical protein [Spongiimicrobium salis]|uniref:hypothetical protein n=1 Tax=Spongiimicrobium salis TaxID=1667022 RepID=UPI00374D518B